MVNLSVFDYLGPLWAHLDPFGPFQTRNDILLRSTSAKPYFVLNLSEFFYVHFPGRGSHFSKGDHSKNAKGPGFQSMQERTDQSQHSLFSKSEISSDVSSAVVGQAKTSTNQLADIQVSPEPFAFFERSPLEK